MVLLLPVLRWELGGLRPGPEHAGDLAGEVGAQAVRAAIESARNAGGSLLASSLGAVTLLFGLWGVFILSPFLQSTVESWLVALLGWIPIFAGPPFGVGMFAAGVILTLMILPTIIAISRDVIRAVPDNQREAMLAGVEGDVGLALDALLGDRIPVQQTRDDLARAERRRDNRVGVLRLDARVEQSARLDDHAEADVEDSLVFGVGQPEARGAADRGNDLNKTSSDGYYARPGRACHTRFDRRVCGPGSNRGIDAPGVDAGERFAPINRFIIQGGLL